MRKLVFIMIGIGLLSIAISIGTNVLGIGGYPGVGATQLFGILAGVALATTWARSKLFPILWCHILVEMHMKVAQRKARIQKIQILKAEI